MSRDMLYIPVPLLIPTDSRAGEEGSIRAVDHAVIGGVVAVVVFAMLCLLIILGRYFARHKGKPGAWADRRPRVTTAPAFGALCKVVLDRQLGLCGYTASLILEMEREENRNLSSC